MTPLVSVLIPCYNAEKFIGETLESVFRQSWPRLEVIVVDDGSTDGSARVVDGFRDPRLLLERQENRGQTAALNACLGRATGEFVQYLDADDLISPEKIEVQASRLLTCPRAVATARWGRFHGSPQETRFEEETVARDMAPLDWLAESRANGLGMMFPALWLIPMSLVRAAGPWKETLTLNNDAEYFTRVLLCADRVLFCPEAKSYYRSGIAGSLSGRKTPEAMRSQFDVIDLCERHVLACEDSDRMRRGFALSWQHFGHACYPYDRTLAEKALARAEALHPVRVWPDGGPAFHVASRVLGWRMARRLQVASGRP